MSGFVDEAQLHVKAGDGGAGAVSFRREAHVAKGGPDGGDGGRGGDVWLLADHDTASLLPFKDHPYRRAGNGTHGQGRGRHGAAGDDTTVKVPEGTVVRSLDGDVLADLVRSGDRWQAGKGGQGGRGNARFLSNRRRAPATRRLMRHPLSQPEHAASGPPRSDAPPSASVVSRNSTIVQSIVRVRTGTRTREPTCNCAPTGSGSS